MPIETERYGQVLVARLEDELVDENTARLEAALEDSVVEGCRRIVIDFERTEMIDSAGLECLADLLGQLQEAGGSVRVSGLDGSCRKVFEMTRFDKRFEVFGSLIEAVKSFR